MTRLRLLLASALALGLAACGGTTTPDFAAGTPDVAGLTLETTGGAGDGLLASAPGVSASALQVDASAAPAAPITCASYEWTCNIRKSIVGVNSFVRAALEPVEALVAAGNEAKPSDDVRVYGPAQLPATGPVAVFQLTVRSLGDDTFRWRLEAKPLPPSTAAFQVVMAGQLHRGDLPHRGRGFLGIDLDAFRGIVNDPAKFAGQGKLLAAFAHVGLTKSLMYAAQAFSADGVATPVSAIFTGWKNELGVARVRLVASSEYVAPNGGGTDAGNELLLSRIGYWPAIGGRTALAVVGGDVPSYTVNGVFDVHAFVGVECFAPNLTVGYRAMFTCGMDMGMMQSRCVSNTAFNGGPNAVGTNATGADLTGACNLGTVLYPDANAGPGTDPNAQMMEPGAPAAPDAPPTAMPMF